MATAPLIYEIDTWPWLERLSRAAGRRLTLADVPAATWDDLAALGVDVVWLMGVWRRSPAGTAIAMADPERMAVFRVVLPDLTGSDMAGSPYCIRDYVVDDHLGGPAGLATARRSLAVRGMRLLLDFVPNHVAPDHPWTDTRPGRFVRGSAGDLARDPRSFVRAGDQVLACGRDPYFPAWTDVVQLDAFSPDLRAAATETLGGILDQCDGVRADMAMLLLNDVFAQTWGDRVGPPPATEYWTDIIDAVRATHPDALLVAEAYWGLEWRLQQLGFDHCYDKRLYDRLASGDAEAVRLHLCADLGYQQGLARFTENHDEPRAAAAFAGERNRAAAVVALALPGARLLHDGQLEGRRVQLPVFLGRMPDEAPDADLERWFRAFLGVLREPVLRSGTWSLCERWGWPGNDRWAQLLAWSWARSEAAEGDPWLLVVNLGPESAAGHVAVPSSWVRLRGATWTLDDPVHGTAFERSGDDLLDGFYVELPAWSSHLFRVRATGA